MKLAKQVGKHTSISLYKAVVTNNRKVHKPPNADKQSQNTVLFARKPLTCISDDPYLRELRVKKSEGKAKRAKT
jgi:hypothetical protein